MNEGVTPRNDRPPPPPEKPPVKQPGADATTAPVKDPPMDPRADSSGSAAGKSAAPSSSDRYFASFQPVARSEARATAPTNTSDRQPGPAETSRSDAPTSVPSDTADRHSGHDAAASVTSRGPSGSDRYFASFQQVPRSEASGAAPAAVADRQPGFAETSRRDAPTSFPGDSTDRGRSAREAGPAGAGDRREPAGPREGQAAGKQQPTDQVPNGAARQTDVSAEVRIGDVAEATVTAPDGTKIPLRPISGQHLSGRSLVQENATITVSGSREKGFYVEVNNLPKEPGHREAAAAAADVAKKVAEKTVSAGIKQLGEGAVVQGAAIGLSKVAGLGVGAVIGVLVPSPLIRESFVRSTLEDGTRVTFCLLDR